MTWQLSPAPPMLRVRAGKALLVSLEAVRMVVARDEVYVLSAPFRGQLKQPTPATSDNAFVRNLVFHLRAPPAKSTLAGWCVVTLRLHRS